MNLHATAATKAKDYSEHRSTALEFGQLLYKYWEWYKLGGGSCGGEAYYFI